MDAMDILGGLLRQKSGGSGLGGQILKSIINGGRSTAPAAPESRPVPQMPAGRPRIVDAPAEAAEPQLSGLEDMLRQAHSRSLDRLDLQHRQLRLRVRQIPHVGTTTHRCRHSDTRQMPASGAAIFPSGPSVEDYQ
jgi:hypothetical protein